MRRAVILLGTVSFGLWGCPAPGKGAQAEREYARARPIITALAAYHRAGNEYPSRLSVLAPRYLDSGTIDSAFSYRSDSGDYELSFRYYGPGSNRCTYRGSAGKWSCSGLF